MIKTKTTILTKESSFLNECKDNFGRWTKKDFEIAFMHYYLSSGHSNDSYFKISRDLKITESKVKSLCYEVSLRYQDNEEHYKKQIIAMLNNGAFKFSSDNKRIQFSVKDKMIWHYISDILQHEGSFIDSSYIADIITITPLDLMILVTSVAQSKQEAKQTIKNIKYQIQSHDKDLPQNWQKTLIEYACDIALEFGDKHAPIITKWLTKQIECLKFEDFPINNN